MSYAKLPEAAPIGLQVHPLNTADLSVLPVGEAPVRPPAAFTKMKELSAITTGHFILLEYMEEHPLLLSNPGMGAQISTFYRKKSSIDNNWKHLLVGRGPGANPPALLRHPLPPKAHYDMHQSTCTCMHTHVYGHPDTMNTAQLHCSPTVTPCLRGSPLTTLPTCACIQPLCPCACAPEREVDAPPHACMSGHWRAQDGQEGEEGAPGDAMPSGSASGKEKWQVGKITPLAPDDDSPFLGELQPGAAQVPHPPPSDVFPPALCVRPPNLFCCCLPLWMELSVMADRADVFAMFHGALPGCSGDQPLPRPGVPASGAEH